MTNETLPPAIAGQVEQGVRAAPERADLYDDIICHLKFDPLTRSEQYAQIDRAVAAELPHLRTRRSNLGRWRSA